MPRTLRSQVQSLSVLPILGLAGVAILVSVVLTHRQVDAEAGRKLQEVSHLLAVTTRDRSAALSAQTQLLADMPSLKAAVQTGDFSVLSDRTWSFVKRNPTNSLIVTNAHGQVVKTFGKISATHLDRGLIGLVRK